MWWWFTRIEKQFQEIDVRITRLEMKVDDLASRVEKILERLK